MTRRRTVLVVSYHFAPSSAVGAKRFSFLAREFSDLGYDVRVVAAPLRDSHHGKGVADPSLPLAEKVIRREETRQLPLAGSGWRVRIANAFWRRLLAPVGWEYFWRGPAVLAARELAAGGERGVVIATVPPSSAAMAGARIAHELDWPLILDYRDPWNAYPWPRYRKGRLAQWIGRRIESYYVGRSAARVFNTVAMRKWFEHYFPSVPAESNYVVPNGFDAMEGAGEPPQAGPFEIVHAGAIYTDRSLVPVLRAAANLSARQSVRGVRLVNYGEVPPPERERIRAAGLESFLEVRPRVQRDELFAHLRRAHVLLAISGDDMTYSAPYKVYDYLAVGRPILALSGEGTTLQKLIAETEAGICTDAADVEGIERALKLLLQGTGPLWNRMKVQEYLWSNLALRYRRIIEAVRRRREFDRLPALAESASQPTGDL